MEESFRTFIRSAIATIDPVILHIAPPRFVIDAIEKERRQSRTPHRAAVYNFIRKLVQDQLNRGGGASLEVNSYARWDWSACLPAIDARIRDGGNSLRTGYPRI